MNKTTLTLKDVQARKEAPRLVFAAGRFVTRGAPRAGGLGSVYRATDTDTGDTVALKVLRRSQGASDAVIEESFRREVAALSDLKHESIVRIIDSGPDESQSAHYIAMEWVETDLTPYVGAQRFSCWDDYFGAIGRPILDALVFAHSRSVVHRDVKPSNILISSAGQVKLCDFGISKVRSHLQAGLTLAQFSSAPYAPPESDDGSYTYSRDVFAYAAVAAAVFSSKLCATHEDIYEALESRALDDSVRQILVRCLSIGAPEARYQNAVILQSALERLSPKSVAPKKDAIGLLITSRVRAALEYDLGLGGRSAEQFVESDLADARCEEVAPSDDHPVRSFRLYGSRYGYHGVKESDSQLKLVNALDWSPSELDRKREAALEVPFAFKVNAHKSLQPSRAVDDLTERLVSHTAGQKQRKIEQREQAIYRSWTGLLSAKTELERQRKVSSGYSEVSLSGEFAKLLLASPASASTFVGQDIAIETGKGVFYGTGVAHDGRTLIAKATDRSRLAVDALPAIGKIETDTSRSDVALDKQKSALEAVRYGRSVNPLLGDQIINPSNVPVPARRSVDFVQVDLDEDKRDAVLAAMSGPEILLIEGPPGTGKTTFITEVILQTLRQTPEARILLTSQTHVALDNSLERLMRQEGEPIRAVRIGHDTDERIALSTRPILLDAKLPAMREEAIASGRAFIEQWALEHGVSVSDTRVSLSLERHAVLMSRFEEVDALLRGLEVTLADGARALLGAEERDDAELRVVALNKEREALEKQLRESSKQLATHFNKDDLKTIAGFTSTELKDWAAVYCQSEQLKALLICHAEWETRFGRSREFRAALIASSQVVAGTCLGVMAVPGRQDIVFDLCIVDEASIATPTEALVPMSRARRTILVGDSRQLSPFQDPDLQSKGLLERFGLSKGDQKETLFNRLRDGLPAELRKGLSTQHRMLPAIGDLISECFYEGALRSVPREPSSLLAGIYSRPVVWLTTSKRANKASRKEGNSHYNELEVSLAIAQLTKIDSAMRQRNGKASVALLTGYGEQKDRLRAAVETKRQEWPSFSEIFVNVVDAFQGREADVVLFSVTRSEAEGLGFLREMERINVALSRARELLVIIGDHYYCQTIKGADNALREVIDYIRRHPEACVLEEATK